MISFSIKMLLLFLSLSFPRLYSLLHYDRLYFTFSLFLFPLLNHYLISTLLNFSTQISSPKDNFLIKNTILTTGWLFTFILLVFFFCLNNILFFFDLIKNLLFLFILLHFSIIIYTFSLFSLLSFPD